MPVIVRGGSGAGGLGNVKSIIQGRLSRPATYVDIPSSVNLAKSTALVGGLFVMTELAMYLPMGEVYCYIDQVNRRLYAEHSGFAINYTLLEFDGNVDVQYGAATVATGSIDIALPRSVSNNHIISVWAVPRRWAVQYGDPNNYVHGLTAYLLNANTLRLMYEGGVWTTVLASTVYWRILSFN